MVSVAKWTHSRMGCDHIDGPKSPPRWHGYTSFAEAERGPHAAAAPIWSRVGDCSSGAQASFIFMQHNHSANTLEVRMKLEIFKNPNPLKVVFHTFTKCRAS